MNQKTKEKQDDTDVNRLQPGPDLSIWDRVIGVRAELKAVAKDKQVGEGRYAYNVATHEELNKHLKPLLCRWGLVDYVKLTSREMVDTTKRQGKEKNLPVMRYEGQYDYVLVTANGDELVVPVEGHGEDANDKAPGKATTYAFKTGRRLMFSVSTGEDEEGRNEDQTTRVPVETLTNEQFSQLQQFVDECWGDDEAEFLERFGKVILKGTYNVEALIEVPSAHFEHVKKQLQNQAKRENRLPEDEAL